VYCRFECAGFGNDWRVGVNMQMLQAAATLACYSTSKMAAENIDVFANAWSSQINDLSVLVKDINDACHGKADRQVYLSLPRPGVSFSTALNYSSKVFVTGDHR